MPVIDATQVAVLYETITGTCQKRGSISCTGSDTVDITAFLAAHPGLAAVIVERSSLPGPNANEAYFRQVISTATSTPLLTGHEDRCIQVGPNAVTPVVSINRGNVTGVDEPDPGHSLVTHAHAEVGDTYTHATGAVTRRYAVVNPTTGLVDQIANLAVGPSIPLSPIPGDVLVPSLTLQVGHAVPLKTAQ
jgi:hypothetical protein